VLVSSELSDVCRRDVSGTRGAIGFRSLAARWTLAFLEHALPGCDACASDGDVGRSREILPSAAVWLSMPMAPGMILPPWPMAQ
jgi:hypothetical protein